MNANIPPGYPESSTGRSHPSDFERYHRDVPVWDDAVVPVWARESRGDALRRGLRAPEQSAATAKLVAEAGRIADRLDRLGEQLVGGAWLRMRIQDLAAGMDTQTVNVNVTIRCGPCRISTAGARAQP
jgi:hypothetical protein